MGGIGKQKVRFKKFSFRLFQVVFIGNSDQEKLLFELSSIIGNNYKILFERILQELLQIFSAGYLKRQIIKQFNHLNFYK